MVDLINTKSLREHLQVFILIIFLFTIVFNSQTVYLTGILFVSQKKCQVEVVIISALYYIELRKPNINSIFVSIYRHPTTSLII